MLILTRTLSTTLAMNKSLTEGMELDRQKPTVNQTRVLWRLAPMKNVMQR